MTIDLVAALLMALAGSGHCIMMCGGIAGAFAGQVNARQLLIYNLGRISSYTMAGAIVGAAFAGVADLTSGGLTGLRLLAGLVLICFGLYLGQWWFGLRHLERMGKPLWQRIQPLATKLRQQRSYPALFGAGMLWGWLPCGLVYSALSWSAVSGSASQGALLMFAFGLGTLPSMFAFGWLSRQLQQLLRSLGFRQLMGAAMIFYGIWTLIVALRQLHVIH